LGGIIIGNPHLKNSGSAQAILNEVNGGSPSQLRGYTEVAGQSARVIVANPYGITCNGCGFINTPRVTLTTGKPVLDGGGRLDRFQVDQGSVSIEGDGLNADNIDRFEIITRSAKINAEIQAKNLTIVAGRNDVNADSLNATARAEDGSAKPQLAIDSSALGGMYAGAIKLVGTEAGVGVKLAGNLAASGGDIQIDANGHLSLVQTSAAGAVSVKAASLETQGAVWRQLRQRSNQGNLTIQQTVAARDSVALSAGGQLTNNGIIEAGVNADNSRNANGDVSLSAQTLDNTGKTVASRNLTVNTAQTLTNQGGTLSAAQAANMTAGTLDNQNNGRVLSNGSLNLTANQVLNGSGLITSTGQLSATLGHLNNRNGELSSLATATLRMATLDNVAGLVNAGQVLSITATGLVNNQNGKLTSLDSLNVNAGKVDNSNKGRIASNKALTATVNSLDQHDGGQLTSGTLLTLDLNHGELNNQNGLINAPVLVLKISRRWTTAAAKFPAPRLSRWRPTAWTTATAN
jgi:filamentous hemagglutinin